MLASVCRVKASRGQRIASPRKRDLETTPRFSELRQCIFRLQSRCNLSPFAKFFAAAHGLQTDVISSLPQQDRNLVRAAQGRKADTTSAAPKSRSSWDCQCLQRFGGSVKAFELDRHVVESYATFTRSFATLALRTSSQTSRRSMRRAGFGPLPFCP